jgi:hypothetical protein
LRVWSRVRAGTEVELSIPSQIAFVSAPPAGWLSRFRHALRIGKYPSRGEK